MAAKRFSGKRANWSELAERWKRSGQNVAAFCRQRGLNPSGLYAWRRRNGTKLTAKASPGAAADFVPVTVIPSAAAPTPVLEIELGNGRLLRLHGDLTPDRLAGIASALERVAC
jgi:hypothetical protein